MLINREFEFIREMMLEAEQKIWMSPMNKNTIILMRMMRYMIFSVVPPVNVNQQGLIILKLTHPLTLILLVVVQAMVLLKKMSTGTTTLKSILYLKHLALRCLNAFSGFFYLISSNLYIYIRKSWYRHLNF